MSFVATAVIGAAVVGAGATAYASSQSSNAIKSSTNASIAAQQTAQQQQQALNAPYAAIGTGTPGANGQPGTGGAIQQYQNLLGLGPQGTAGIEASLAATPGYQFAKDQGIQATTNAATLTNPGGISGNTLTALDTFSTGLADSTYQNAVGNAQNATTIGQNAAAGTGSGILQTGANVGAALSGAGNTIAGIDANEAAGISKAAQGGLTNYTTLNTLNNLNSGSVDPGIATGANNLAGDTAGQIANWPVG
jgi:hypothetical protein